MARESTIRVFVALADNRSQGIVPVPARIGNGDDPANNLYWGCSDGLPPVFSRSRHWKRTERSAGKGPILEQQMFRNARYPVTLTAMAYRGREIKSALADFFAEVARPADGPLSLAAFIGHNGLMDFTLETPRATGKGKPAIVLCCKSRDYFAPSLRYYQSRGVLLTTQLMYPGAFLLHDALESYFAGGTAKAIHEAAAKAYAKNQKISARAARGVFVSTPPNLRMKAIHDIQRNFR